MGINCGDKLKGKKNVGTVRLVCANLNGSKTVDNVSKNRK